MDHTILQAIQAIKAGKMLVVVDDEDRENEGDLVMAACHASEDHINFMASLGKGLICAPMSATYQKRLGIDLMVNDNSDPLKTAFTVSVDHVSSTTGISCQERATTLKALADLKSSAHHFVKPGHVFPLVAHPGGLLKRQGHTEAAVALAELAGLPPVGVICEIIGQDGKMLRGQALKAYANHHDLVFITIKNLVAYIKNHQEPVRLQAQTPLPTRYGTIDCRVYVEEATGKEHVALVHGAPDPKTNQAPLVRLHSSCLTGDVFGSNMCDCGKQLDAAMHKISQAPYGMVLYMNQEGRGIGLTSKIKAYALQAQGLDTVDANLALGYAPDERSYHAAAAILKDLGASHIDLLTNNPDKIKGLTQNGITITKRIPHYINHHPNSQTYMQTKKTRMRHMG